MSEFSVGKYPSNRRENKVTTAVREAYDLVRIIAGEPRRPVKVALNRAAVRLAPYLPLSLSRITDLYYGEARLIRAEEIDALRLVAAETRRKIEAGNVALRGIADVYRGAAERLRAIDPAFHSVEIARLERLARDCCPADRTGAAPIGDGPASNEGRE